MQKNLSQTFAFWKKQTIPSHSLFVRPFSWMSRSAHWFGRILPLGGSLWTIQCLSQRWYPHYLKMQKRNEYKRQYHSFTYVNNTRHVEIQHIASRLSMKYLLFSAKILASTFFPCQLTVTLEFSAKFLSFSKINHVGAIPVRFSFGKYNNAFKGCFPVSLHTCLKVRAMMKKSNCFKLNV